MKHAHTWLGLAVAVLMVPELSAAQATNGNQNKREVTMDDTQANKETVRRIYEQALNKRDLELLHDFVSEAYVGARGATGVAGFRVPVVALIEGFPDAQWKVEQLIGEGDKVVVKWKVEGTHTGSFRRIPATGKEVSNDGIGIYEFENGKVVDARIHTDRLGFLQQLGVVPSDVAALPSRNGSSEYVRFVDTFVVPEEAREEFVERVNVNRRFIRTLPGFVEDHAYERTDEQGNTIYMTIAVWESEDALDQAKAAGREEYQKQGFDPAEMMERLNITMEREVYRAAAVQP